MLKVFVHQHGGDEANKLEIPGLSDECTVMDLKQSISEKIQPPCGADAMKVVFRGKILKDDQQLISYGFATGMTVHVVRSRSPASPAPVVATGAAAAAASATAASISPPAPNIGVGAQTGAFPSSLSPFRSMNMFGGVGEGGVGGGDAAGNLNRDLTAGLLQNPQMMQGFMNNPAFQQILGNPETMSRILSTNPLTRSLMESNPEMRRALEDPESLRTMMAAGTNPNLMAELQRNQDRALSNIEGMPGGFNALRRMYTEVAAPLKESIRDTITPSRVTDPTTPSTTDTAGSAVPNPWGAPGTRTGGGGVDPFAGMFGGMGGGVDPFGGVGGGLGGGIPPAGISAMMQNPQMMQMMTQMMQDPNFMRMAEAQNPTLRQMFESQPGLRDMFRDPSFLQMAMNPQVLQIASSLNQRGLGPSAGAFGGFPGLAPGVPPTGFLPTGVAAPSPAPGTAVPGVAAPLAPGGGMAEMLQMLQTMNGGGVGGGGFGGGWGTQYPSLAPPPDPRPASERFAGQLGQMRDMGFSDDAQSLRALEAVHGNVQMAVERILDGRV